MILELEHIYKDYMQGSMEVHILKDISLAVAEGEYLAVMGPSGSGKTTLMNIIGCLDKPTSGTYHLNGEDVLSYSDNELSDTRLYNIGFVFQSFHLLPKQTALENVYLPLIYAGVSKKERIALATEALERVGLGDRLHFRPTQLSGGQQQRVAIARALVKNPRLLLLDEPLSNLDARLRLEMREEIRRIQQRTGVTTIFVTHDQEEALSISDRIVLMRSGVLQQNDLPQRLYNEPANQFVADFLGNPPINNIPGTIQNGLFVTEDGKAEAKLPMLEGVENGRKVNFSVRSESFVLDEKGPIACEVTRMYQMGKEEMAYLRMGGHDFRAYIDADAGLKAGDHVRLGLKKRGVFLFDRETGERIR